MRRAAAAGNLSVIADQPLPLSLATSSFINCFRLLHILAKIVHFLILKGKLDFPLSPFPSPHEGRGSLSSKLLISSGRALYSYERYNYPQEGEAGREGGDVALNILTRAPLSFVLLSLSSSCVCSTCLLLILGHPFSFIFSSLSFLSTARRKKCKEM